jgi:hypothetical protein
MRKLFVLYILAFPWLAAAQTPTANVAVQRLSGMRFADQFTGASVAAQINAAVADCGTYTGLAGNSCIVIIPSTLGCGEPNESPDNVIMWDFRNCAQSQGLRFNLSHTVTGGVRSKMFLQDNFDAGLVGLGNGNKHSASVYFSLFVDNPQATTGSIQAFNASAAIDSQAGTFNGVLVAGEFDVSANATNSAPRTVNDMRGIHTGVGALGGNTSVNNAYGIYVGAPSNSGTGTLTNAYGIRIEPFTLGTTTNLGLWNQEKTEFDKQVSIGTAPDNASALFINNGLLQPTSGTQQKGIFSVLRTGPDATSEGSALWARADTAAAAYSQALNTGIHVLTPTVGAGSTITEWDGVRIEAGPTAGSKFGIQQVGPGDTNQFAGPTKANGGVTVGLNGVLVTVHQHARVTTGSIGATTRREVLLTWPKTMTNTNYTVTCNVEDSTTPAGTQGLTFERIRTKSATRAGAVIHNPTGGAITGTLDCSADQD